MVESLTLNQMGVGSSPTSLTNLGSDEFGITARLSNV